MKLILLGDIALFGNLSNRNNHSLKSYFNDIADYLSNADYVVGNLETPFSIRKKTNGSKSAYICSDIEDIEILKFLHIDAVTLANNHVFDYGKEGYELTKKILADNKIDYWGVEGRDLLLEIGGNKLAFSGFCCYSTNPLNCVPYGQYGVNEFDLRKTEDVLYNNQKNGYLNIVSVHAGIEHVNYPSWDTISAAHLLAQKYSYIYYGHHPHVSQGIEKLGDSLIAYSLGNFCFDDVYSSVSQRPLIELSENNRSSFMLEICIEGNKIISYNTIPIYIGKDKMYIGQGTSEKDLKKFSDAISHLSKEEYVKRRNKIITDYVTSRKNKRNLIWFIKRLKPRYLFIILEMRRNRQKYKRVLQRYL